MHSKGTKHSRLDALYPSVGCRTRTGTPGGVLYLTASRPLMSSFLCFNPVALCGRLGWAWFHVGRFSPPQEDKPSLSLLCCPCGRISRLLLWTRPHIDVGWLCTKYTFMQMCTVAFAILQVAHRSSNVRFSRSSVRFCRAWPTAFERLKSTCVRLQTMSASFDSPAAS